MLPTPLNWKKGVTGIVPKLSWEQQREDWATTHTVPYQAAHISGTNWRVASYLETHLAPSLWWFYSPSQGKCYNCSLCWLTAPLRPNDLDKISEVKRELTCASHLGYFFSVYKWNLSQFTMTEVQVSIFYPVVCVPLAAYFFHLSYYFAASLNRCSKVLGDMPLITPTFTPHLLCYHPFIRSAFFHHCFWAHYSTFSWTELHLPFIRYF